MADITTSNKNQRKHSEKLLYAFQYQYVDGGNESAVSKIDVSALGAKSANGDTCTGLKYC